MVRLFRDVKARRVILEVEKELDNRKIFLQHAITRRAVFRQKLRIY